MQKNQMFSEAGFLYFQFEEKLHHLCLWVFHCELYPSTDNSNIVIINVIKIIARSKMFDISLAGEQKSCDNFFGDHTHLPGYPHAIYKNMNW